MAGSTPVSRSTEIRKTRYVDKGPPDGGTRAIGPPKCPLMVAAATSAAD